MSNHCVTKSNCCLLLSIAGALLLLGLCVDGLGRRWTGQQPQPPS
jgi:hypothetical protein